MAKYKEGDLVVWTSDIEIPSGNIFQRKGSIGKIGKQTPRGQEWGNELGYDVYADVRTRVAGTAAQSYIDNHSVPYTGQADAFFSEIQPLALVKIGTEAVKKIPWGWIIGGSTVVLAGIIYVATRKKSKKR